jgi:hypothetical protein
MKPSTVAILLASFAAEALAGNIVWDGNFDYYNTVADFDKWSWSNLVGEYQNYIHGSAGTAAFLALDPSYKNPASKESHGLKLTINGNSKWNNFQRTELIPQTTANLGTGNLFYHFSMKRGTSNGPTTSEHQLNFFESHFTEIKVGVGSDLTALQWCVSGVPKWSTAFTPNTWYNFAYDIDFAAQTVGLWYSTGSNPLTKVMANIGASTSTNSADWHLGGLRLTDSTAVEEYYYSGVYIEQGPITTSIGSGSTVTTTTQGTTSNTSKTTSSTKISTSSTTKVSSTSATPTPTGCQSPKYGQCGGTSWTGCVACVAGSTCTYSNPYYSQCL